MRQMENKYRDDKFKPNISMITIKYKCSKHFSSKVEVIRLHEKARPNYIPSTETSFSP